MSKKVGTENYVLLELYDTESKYVNHLGQLKNFLIDPLIQKGADITQEFVFALAVIYDINTQFKESLENCVKPTIQLDRVLDLFISYSSKFNTYKIYMEHYSQNLEYIGGITTQQQYLQIFSDAASNGCQTYDSLLIMPVQRLPRYYLLLNTLKKCIHDEKHRARIDDVLKSLDYLVVFCNESIRNYEQYTRKVQLYELCGKNPLFFKKGRNYRGEADLSKQSTGKQINYLFCFFSDCIMYIKKDTIHRVIPLEFSFIRDLPDNYINNSFQFVSPDRTFIIICPNGVKQKEEIIDLMKTLYDEYIETNHFSTTKYRLMAKDVGAPFCMNIGCNRPFGLIERKQNCLKCGMVYCNYCGRNWKNQFTISDLKSLCIYCHKIEDNTLLFYQCVSILPVTDYVGSFRSQTEYRNNESKSAVFNRSRKISLPAFFSAQGQRLTPINRSDSSYNGDNKLTESVSEIYIHDSGDGFQSERVKRAMSGTIAELESDDDDSSTDDNNENDKSSREDMNKNLSYNESRNHLLNERITIDPKIVSDVLLNIKKLVEPPQNTVEIIDDTQMINKIPNDENNESLNSQLSTCVINETNDDSSNIVNFDANHNDQSKILQINSDDKSQIQSDKQLVDVSKKDDDNNSQNIDDETKHSHEEGYDVGYDEGFENYGEGYEYYGEGYENEGLEEGDEYPENYNEDGVESSEPPINVVVGTAIELDNNIEDKKDEIINQNGDPTEKDIYSRVETSSDQSKSSESVPSHHTINSDNIHTYQTTDERTVNHIYEQSISSLNILKSNSPFNRHKKSAFDKSINNKETEMFTVNIETKVVRVGLDGELTEVVIPSNTSNSNDNKSLNNTINSEMKSPLKNDISDGINNISNCTDNIEPHDKSSIICPKNNIDNSSKTNKTSTIDDGNFSNTVPSDNKNPNILPLPNTPDQKQTCTIRDSDYIPLDNSFEEVNYVQNPSKSSQNSTIKDRNDNTSLLNPGSNTVPKISNQGDTNLRKSVFDESTENNMNTIENNNNININININDNSIFSLIPEHKQSSNSGSDIKLFTPIILTNNSSDRSIDTPHVEIVGQYCDIKSEDVSQNKSLNVEVLDTNDDISPYKTVDKAEINNLSNKNYYQPTRSLDFQPIFSPLVNNSSRSYSGNKSPIIAEVKRKIYSKKKQVSNHTCTSSLSNLNQTVRVGCGVILSCIRHPDCVLIGLRKGSHGAGKWALPGGHLDMNETWQTCIKRELKEETGLTNISEPIFCYVTNDIMSEEGKHYITLFMESKLLDESEPQIIEPDRCQEWKWVEWSQLNEYDLFIPLLNIISSGYTPSNNY